MKITKRQNLGESIANRIREIIIQLGYNNDLNAFARKIGASKNAIVNVWSKKNPTMSMLENIHEIFPVDKEWLFTGKGDPWIADPKPFKLENTEVDHREVDVDINNRIKSIRIQNGYTQAIFAGELNINRDIVSSIENLRTSANANIIKRMVAKFKVNPYWVLFGSGDQYLSISGLIKGVKR